MENSKAFKVILMSEQTKSKLSLVADKLKGRELFAHRIELAKKSLKGLKSLPI
jgi:hypothetical protein